MAEYLKDLNATQAAIRAGYSPKAAEVQGCRLLRMPQVRTAVAHGPAKLLAAAEISAERTLEELAQIAFSDIRALFEDDGRLKPLSGLSPDARAALASVQVVRRRHPDGGGTERLRIRLWDKVRALEILAGRFGLLSGNTQQVVEVNARWMTDGNKRTGRLS